MLKCLGGRRTSWSAGHQHSPTFFYLLWPRWHSLQHKSFLHFIYLISFKCISFHIWQRLYITRICDSDQSAKTSNNFTFSVLPGLQWSSLTCFIIDVFIYLPPKNNFLALDKTANVALNLPLCWQPLPKFDVVLDFPKCLEGDIKKVVSEGMLGGTGSAVGSCYEVTNSKFTGLWGSKKVE